MFLDDDFNELKYHLTFPFQIDNYLLISELDDYDYEHLWNSNFFVR